MRENMSGMKLWARMFVMSPHVLRQMVLPGTLVSAQLATVGDSLVYLLFVPGQLLLPVRREGTPVTIMNFFQMHGVEVFRY